MRSAPSLPGPDRIGQTNQSE